MEVQLLVKVVKGLDHFMKVGTIEALGTLDKARNSAGQLFQKMQPSRVAQTSFPFVK